MIINKDIKDIYPYYYSIHLDIVVNLDYEKDIEYIRDKEFEGDDNIDALTSGWDKNKDKLPVGCYLDLYYVVNNG